MSQLFFTEVERKKSKEKKTDKKSPEKLSQKNGEFLDRLIR